jgi:hypothetical protein
MAMNSSPGTTGGVTGEELPPSMVMVSRAISPKVISVRVDPFGDCRLRNRAPNREYADQRELPR